MLIIKIATVVSNVASQHEGSGFKPAIQLVLSVQSLYVFPTPVWVLLQLHRTADEFNWLL